MDTIIDLTDSGGSHDVLHSTGSGGLMGGNLLNDRPLAEYLEDDEQVQYVLRNKKSGLDVVSELGSTETLAPGGDYQTLAAVTDRRLLVVAGQSAGNETRSLSFTEVLEARTESSGLRTNTLDVETLSGDTWRFQCKGDPDPVAAYIEDVAQTWANADRLLDDVEGQIETAEDHLADGQQDAAIEVLGGAQETVATARQRSEDLGPGPRTAVQERAHDVAARLSELQRAVAASRGADAHGEAQAEWQQGNYEAAAQAYEMAVTAYETALDRDGSTPSDFTLAKRLRGAAAERELLRAGPLLDADAARRKATRLTDPQDAANEWETALESFRDMLGLDWGESERSFVADKQRIQEYAKGTAGDAITDHREAGRKWLAAGDDFSVEGREEKAQQVYERAKEQFERAHRLASEVRPERADDLTEDVEVAEKRLAGEGIPEEKQEETVIPSDNESDDETADSADGEETITAKETQIAGSGVDQPGTDSEQSAETGGDQPTAPDSDQPGDADDDPATAVSDDGGSLIDKIKSDKKRRASASKADDTDAGASDHSQTTDSHEPSESAESAAASASAETASEPAESGDAGERVESDDGPSVTDAETTLATRHVGSSDGAETPEADSETAATDSETEVDDAASDRAATEASATEAEPTPAIRHVGTDDGADDGTEGGDVTDGETDDEVAAETDDETDDESEEEADDEADDEVEAEVDNESSDEADEEVDDELEAEADEEVDDGEVGDDAPAGTDAETPAADAGSSTPTSNTTADTADTPTRIDEEAAAETVTSGASAAGVGELTDEEIAQRLATLDEDAFTEFVADVWEAQGWSTTVFSATAKAVYDIMAMRKEPEEHRLLLWTVHRPDGGALGATVVKRCATARDGSQGADSATLVTTGSLTAAAERSADDLGVSVVDSEKLTDLVQFEGLEDRLDEVADTGRGGP